MNRKTVSGIMATLLVISMLTLAFDIQPVKASGTIYIRSARMYVPPPPTRTYTLDADFDEGILVGVEHETVHDQLQLSKNVTTLPFIWVPNNEGTVSKVDTATGKEIGRYWVSDGTDSSPSRTTVDLLGNCWVGCRQRGTVVKIGLFEAGQWIDRNLDGICQTSQDTNVDGDITGSEILQWGQDECVLYEVVLVPGYEGVYVPGTYSGSYDYNYWGVSPRGLAIDASNNLWAGTWSISKYFYIDGATGVIIRSVDAAPHNAYGAAIDENGILWSAEGPGSDDGEDSILLRLDPSTDAKSFVDIGHTCYGLGLDYNHHLWVSSYWSDQLSRIDISVDPPTFVTYNTPEQSESRGVAATSDNNIWVANTGANTVTRYDNDGNLTATITGLYYPTGVSVDANGKVWATDRYDEYLHRIDPTNNTIDLSKQIVGSNGHYTYSDMTGIVSRTITTKIGTWTVVFDSTTENTPWGTISWNSNEPTGTSISVKVRSSNNLISWSTWGSVANSVPFSSTPNGRYLQIETTFQIISGTVSPVLYDLTVAALMGVHDIAVTNIVPSKTVVGQGYSVPINVIVENQGGYIENLNVTAYVNVKARARFGHWSFDEGNGTTVHDTSGNDNHGTIYNASWVDGRFGSALSFDGVDDYVRITHSSSQVSNSWTIEAWVYPGRISGASEWGWIIHTKDNVFTAFYRTLGQYNNKFHFLYTTGGTNYMVRSKQNITANTWYHLALSYNDTARTFKIYIDGELDTTHTAPSTPYTTTANVIMGARAIGYTENQYFNGTIDEVGIYNRTLTKEEIATDMTCYGKIQTRNVTLTSGDSTTLTFTWNTTDFAIGKYTLGAVADTVTNETDTADNTYIDGWIIITILGDVNGDFEVDVFDKVIVGAAFGATYNATDGLYWHQSPDFPGPCPYCPHTPNADINGDLTIDVFDKVIVGYHFGETVP